MFYHPSVRSIVFLHWFRFHQWGLKPPALSILPTMQVLVEDVMHISQDKIPMLTQGMPVISGSVPGAWYYLAVWSTSSILGLPAVKLLYKAINPKWWRKLHLGKSNQQKSLVEFNKSAQPVFRSCCVQLNLVTNVERTPKI